ncbi:MAG TPA: chemotaxis protein CheA [Syntrophorhabdaceae bacterium]|nr:chemotaxis protein CheA [Syntrophorhabdaceae bacterium]
MNDAHKKAYREEADEQLVELEDSLLELERVPSDKELVNRVFRSLHTIKGSGAMFGFDEIAVFAHEVETIFDLVRKDKFPVTKALIDLTLKARDCLRMMLKEETREDTLISRVRLAFEELNPAHGPVTSAAAEDKIETTSTVPPVSDVTYRIRFEPKTDLFADGTNPIGIFRELAGLGSCAVVAHLDRIPLLEDYEPELCYLYWDIVLTTDEGEDAIKDAFIFVESLADITIKVADEGYSDTEAPKKLGEILVERNDLKREELDDTLKGQKRLGEMLIDRGVVSPAKIQSALAEQEQVKKRQEKQHKEEAVSSIRVSSDKLDRLIDLVGELVTLHAGLDRKANEEEDPELMLISEQVERLTEELRNSAMSMRMLPIGSTFGRFRRLVRDLSGDLGKEIELVTEGAETELDKTVLERLNDPLVHLIRNSIDHGIEPPDVREQSHKERKGTIRLSATHSGAHVIIRIEDDGRGLIKDAILEKAVEKGLAQPNADLSDREIYDFIFQAGFSTAKQVSNISGRGVGMDVVKRTIDGLKGSIDIQSENGVGTTVTIKLPLTLAIVEGLLVTVTDRYFVLPLSVVEECIELTRDDVQKSHGKNLAYIRGELVPYIRLRNEFGINGDLPDIEQIVVTGANGERVGLVVDNVIGQHQTVIKNLGKIYKDAKGVSGATILGDGSVALIVDVPKVLRNAELAQAVFG